MSTSFSQSIYVIIPAGGIGKRFGASVKKQFLTLQGQPVLQKTISVFLDLPFVTKVIVSLPSDEIEEQKLLFNHDRLDYVLGGENRAASVKNAFDALPICDSQDVVLVHDGVRPLVNSAVIERTIESVIKNGTALPVVPVTDTIKKVDQGVVIKTVDRDVLRAAQTPQGGRYEFFAAAYSAMKKPLDQITDEAMLLESIGCPIHIVEGAKENIKITTPFDFSLAKALLEQHEF